MKKTEPRTAIEYTADSAAKRRADHALENAEDYVELIEEMQDKIGAAHMTDIATHLGVSHVTVHKTIKRLKAQGLVQAEPYRAISLTETGRLLARQSRERHAVTLRFLRVLGVSEGTANNDAEGIEHHVSPELMDMMQFVAEQLEKKGSLTREDIELAKKKREE